MSNIIYLNGEYVPREQAKVSVYDHGLLYGDGIFEGIRIYNYRIFKLEEHIDRLYESAKTIMLDIPMTKEQMIEAHIETARRNNFKDAYIRTVVTRGVGTLGLDPRKCQRPNVIIICDAIALYPREMYEQGLDVVTIPTQRNGVNMLNARIKSLNYLNNIMGKLDVIRANAGEGIMLNFMGYVTEATADNVFIVKNNVVLTPPKHLGILAGITRETVMEIAREKGYKVKEEILTRHDLYIADECFLTGSGAEVIPVVRIDGRIIGDGKPGPVTWELIQAYRELVNSTGTPFRE